MRLAQELNLLHSGIVQALNPIAAGGPGSGRHPYSVFIHKAYFPSELHPKGIGKEDFEQWKVKANSRQEAAKKVWQEHGDRLLRLMGPAASGLGRKVSLHVSGDKGTPPGRLNPITVSPSFVKIKSELEAYSPDQPRADDGRWSSEDEATSHKVEVQPGKQAVDVYTKRGQVTAKIPRSEFPLTPKQEAIERRFSRQIGSDPEKWKAEYRAKFGNVFNADYAKELSPDYRSDRTNAAAVHEPASWLIKQLWKEEMQVERPDKANVVLFTAGSAGSGKTSTVQGDPDAKAALQKAQVVFDGTLRPFNKADEKVEQAINAGKTAAVLYVHRDPEQAFVDGVLGRASRQEKAEGSGRTVMLAEFCHQATSIQDSMKQLVDKYKNNPKFSFGVIDNSYGAGQAKRTILEALPPVKPYAELFSELKGKLDSMYQSGQVSKKIYLATLGAGHSKEVGM